MFAMPMDFHKLCGQMLPSIHDNGYIVERKLLSVHQFADPVVCATEMSTEDSLNANTGISTVISLLSLFSFGKW